MSNYLTIDLEDWYQGLTHTSLLVDQWNRYEKRIRKGCDWLLETLDRNGIRATFFVVGVVAEEHPQLIREICLLGHEVGLHGYCHRLVENMGRKAFSQDLERNAKVVADVIGVQPRGYRAPCFSVRENLGWFWEELAGAGIIYDSSIFPIRTPLYGDAGARRTPYVVTTNQGLVHEFPISTVRLMSVNLPFSGGFYFRALPYAIVRRITRRLNLAGEQVIFYFHPWEFDPDHPVPPATTLRERVSHYGRLRTAREKFLSLLRDVSFQPLGQGSSS
ncbi:MAG: polysaccharide deacetylase family protein [Thermodesulfobacteriota bacterium]